MELLWCPCDIDIMIIICKSFIKKKRISFYLGFEEKKVLDEMSK